MNPIIPILIIVPVILGLVGVSIYNTVRNKIRSFSRSLFGVDDIIDGYNKNKRELSEVPKSVSAMTRVYLPLILADFKEFNYDEFKVKAENMLISALTAITSSNSSKLLNASEDLTNKVNLIIERNALANQKETFENIVIHQTEIKNYYKKNGTCVITLESAVSYFHYIMRDGKLFTGDKTLKQQAKYNIDLIYIQDVSKVGTGYNTSLGTTCPNCGAPITQLGDKHCEFCGAAVREINIYVWAINNYIKL